MLEGYMHAFTKSSNTLINKWNNEAEYVVLECHKEFSLMTLDLTLQVVGLSKLCMGHCFFISLIFF